MPRTGGAPLCALRTFSPRSAALSTLLGGRSKESGRCFVMIKFAIVCCSVRLTIRNGRPSIARMWVMPCTSPTIGMPGTKSSNLVLMRTAVMSGKLFGILDTRISARRSRKSELSRNTLPSTSGLSNFLDAMKSTRTIAVPSPPESTGTLSRPRSTKQWFAKKLAVIVRELLQVQRRNRDDGKSERLTGSGTNRSSHGAALR